MKIIIWTHHPDDLLGKAIDALTHGDAQHAAFLRADGETIVEAYWPQVRQRVLLAAEKPFIRTFKIRGLTPEQETAIEALLDKILLAPPKYSGEDLFRFLFNAPNVDEAHTFCSRLVLHVLEQVLPEDAWILQRLPDDDWGSPRDILISPACVEEIQPAPAPPAIPTVAVTVAVMQAPASVPAATV
jgi:hypothetical protein